MEPPFLQTVVNSKNFEIDSKKFHDAGYDSFITGCCFVNIIRYLYAQEFKEVCDIFSNEILAKFRNKIYMLKNYDIKFMNLEADDIIPDRKHVFYITFPKEWKTNNIYSLFANFGGLYNVNYINDTSAFCILKEPFNSGKVVEKLIRKNRSTSYKVCNCKIKIIELFF